MGGRGHRSLVKMQWCNAHLCLYHTNGCYCTTRNLLGNKLTFRDCDTCRNVRAIDFDELNLQYIMQWGFKYVSNMTSLLRKLLGFLAFEISLLRFDWQVSNELNRAGRCVSLRSITWNVWTPCLWKDSPAIRPAPYYRSRQAIPAQFDLLLGYPRTCLTHQFEAGEIESVGSTDRFIKVPYLDNSFPNCNKSFHWRWYQVIAQNQFAFGWFQHLAECKGSLSFPKEAPSQCAIWLANIRLTSHAALWGPFKYRFRRNNVYRYW